MDNIIPDQLDPLKPAVADPTLDINEVKEIKTTLISPHDPSQPTPRETLILETVAEVSVRKDTPGIVSIGCFFASFIIGFALSFLSSPYTWLALPIIGLVASFVGFIRAKKYGYSNIPSIVGLVLNIVVVLLFSWVLI